MLRTLLALFALCLGLQVQAAKPPTKGPEPEYAIEAIAMRVHGPHWQLRIEKRGAVTYVHWDNQNYLNVQGSLILPRAQIDALINSPAITKLAPLPRSNSPRPVAMHMPEFVIRLHTDTGKHQIEVDDPDTLLPSAELDQFWVAWKAIWSLMPQWKLAPHGASDMFPAQPPIPSPQ